MATPPFQHILIIGATSGLGEAFLKRYHAEGRKVIATGRREDRLSKLKSELPGLETYQFDVNDTPRFQSAVKQILGEHPTIDTVIMMSGVQSVRLFKEPDTFKADSITKEISTNLIAPCVLAEVLVPHFLSIKTPTNFILVASGLAYVPRPIYPVYNATKAGIHHFALSIRGQLADSPVNIIELAPPYVESELGDHDMDLRKKLYGSEGPKPMSIDFYIDDSFKKLEQRVDGKPLKEIVVGFSETGNSAWRKAYDPILASMGQSAM